MAEYDSNIPPTHIQNIIGDTYGRWTVVGYSGIRGRRNYYVRCRCICGQEKDVSAYSVVSGKSTSCGCYHREITSAIGLRNLTHGMRLSPEYHSWKSMIERCENPKKDNYPRYGGRGIKVCQRWRDSFEAFYNDMGNRPSLHHSLHRINNDGDYTPDNCQWATPKEQARKRATNHLLEFQGREMTITEWSEYLGISRNVISLRIRYGWPIERALTEPVKGRQ